MLYRKKIDLKDFRKAIDKFIKEFRKSSKKSYKSLNIKNHNQKDSMKFQDHGFISEPMLPGESS